MDAARARRKEPVKEAHGDGENKARGANETGNRYYSSWCTCHRARFILPQRTRQCIVCLITETPRRIVPFLRSFKYTYSNIEFTGVVFDFKGAEFEE